MVPSVYGGCTHYSILCLSNVGSSQIASPGFCLQAGHCKDLHEISQGDCKSQAVDTHSVLLAEFGQKALPEERLLWAAKFWNNLSGQNPGSIYKRMALDACCSAIAQGYKNWALSMFRIVMATGYAMEIRQDALDKVDSTALSLFLTQRGDAVWAGLDICLGTCPSEALHPGRRCEGKDESCIARIIPIIPSTGHEASGRDCGAFS